MRRIVIIAVVLLVVGGGGAYAYSRYSAGRAAQKPNIRQVTIDRGDMTLSVNATGSVAALRTAKLSFDTPGLVVAVAVAEGQRVLAGALLAKQDDTGYQLAVTQTEAALRAAQLGLDQLKQPPSEKDLAVAKANVKAAKDSYSAIAGSVDATAVNAAQLKYQQAQQAALDATQHRMDVGGRAKQDSPEFQLALAQEGQASFGVEAARLQVEALKRGPDSRILGAAKSRITLAEAELARLQAGALPVQIDQAELKVRQAQTALDQAKQQLATTELRAPFAGEVTTVTLREGGLSLSTVAGIVLTDRSQLNVNINVDEIDIGQVREGQPVTLTFDALSGELYGGTVARIAPAPNQGTTVTYQVQVLLPPDAMRVKPGMTASTTISIRQLKNIVRVPNIFVRLDRRSGQAYVNLVAPDLTLTEIPVQLGLRTDEYSEVVAGLAEGDSVGVNLDSGFSLFGQ